MNYNRVLKCIFVLMLINLSLLIHAAPSYDHILYTKTQFDVTSLDRVEENFEDTLFMPENFLKIFNPAGVTVVKKSVNGNSFEFLVVKKILGFSKKFDLKGSLTFERVATGCSNSTHSYLGHMDFTPSGPSVTDTIAEVTLLFCVSKKSDSMIFVKSTNTLYYKGDAFGSILEKVAKNLINDQVDAIISAIRTDVQSKK